MERGAMEVVEHHIERLQALLQVTTLARGGARGRELLTAVAETVSRAFGFGTVALNLQRASRGDFVVEVVHGSDAGNAALLGTVTSAGFWQQLLDPQFDRCGAFFVPAGAFGWMDQDVPVFVPEVEPDEGPDQWHPHDALLVPLRHSDGHLLGVLSLDEPLDGLRPKDTDLAVLTGVAAHVAQLLESAEANQARERMLHELQEAQQTVRRQAHTLEKTVRARVRELEQARVESLQRLALAAEFRDDETRQHTERVGSITASLASEIGLPVEQVAVIRHAAPLHDIGKLGVSEGILLKAGKLEPAEREQMQIHTTIGARILAGSQSQVLRIGAEIALTHHERWDGSGYPHRTAGQSIPITGRMTAIADVFDALTHSRPYKEVWPVDEAVAEILRLRRTHFDPRLVDAFMGLDHELLAGLKSRTPRARLCG